MAVWPHKLGLATNIQYVWLCLYCLLIMNGWFWLIDILQVKYLNNIIEQDHRFIKKLTKQMKGFKTFMSASATLDGIEVAHMIRKKQFGVFVKTAFQQFAALAG